MPIAPNCTNEQHASRPSLLSLGASFARRGNFTFGGGSATVATLQREVVERRHWLRIEPFHLCFALSRLTPGTNLLACCTAAGWLMRGWPGAVVSLLAASVPCSVVAVFVTVLYEWWSKSPVMRLAIHGAIAAAVAVMLTTAVTLIRPHWRGSSWVQLLVFVGGSFAANYFLSVPPLRVLLVCAAVGWFWPQRAE